MKRMIHLMAAILIASNISAQGYTVKKHSSMNKAVMVSKNMDYTAKTKADFKKPKKLKIPSNSKEFAPFLIGATVYDLQTNGSMTRRLLEHTDGTMSAVWTRGLEAPSYPDRGTGFNYYDGSAWAPAPEARIEPHRTGWPTIVGIDKDIVFSHGTVTNLNIASNSAYGGSDWSMDELNPTTTMADATFPKAVSAGLDGQTIHLLATSYNNEWNGIQNNIGYFRSTDGGSTWDKAGEPLFGIDNTKYVELSGECYSIDAVGETVAIAVFPTFGDGVLIKSTDNGDTWEKTVILDFPDSEEPFDVNSEILDLDNDGLNDTLLTSDNSVSIVIDNNGLAHVAFGLYRTTPVYGMMVNHFTDGLAYWNEDMGESTFDISQVSNSLIKLNMQLGEDSDTIVHCPDVNNNGVLYEFYDDGSGDYPFGIYGKSLTSFPSLSVDQANNIYLTYSTVMETMDYCKLSANPCAQHFRHLWFTIRSNNDGIWSAPQQLTEGDDFICYEHVYPTATREFTNNKLKLIYQFDDEPGISIVNDEDMAGTNYIFYAEKSFDEFPIIENIQITPEIPTIDDEVNVTANAYGGTGITETWLKWGLSSSNLADSIHMESSGGNQYATETSIPAQALGANVFFRIYVEDIYSNVYSSSLQQYTVNDTRNVSLTNPLGGETFYIGNNLSIEWTYSSITEVNLYMYDFNLSNYFSVNSNPIPASNYSMDYFLGYDLGMDSTKIKITNADDEALFDESGIIYFADTTSPAISEISILPEMPTQIQTVQVYAQIEDYYSIESASLHWGLHQDTINNMVAMNNISGNLYTGEQPIPNHAEGTTIYFYISAENEIGNSKITDTLNYEVMLGLADINAKNPFEIYPNPTDDKIFIINENNTNLSYEIISSSGKMVLQGDVKSSKVQINLTELSSGMYYIKITEQSTNTEYLQKIILK